MVFLNILLRERQRDYDGRGGAGAQRPVLRVNEPKKDGGVQRTSA